MDRRKLCAGQSWALLAAPGPTPAWPSLVGGLCVWCRPQSLGLTFVGCSGGCPEGPPPISHRSRRVLGPPTLAGLGLGDPWLQGAQGCPWNPGEQRGGHGAGCRWAWRGGGAQPASLTFSPPSSEGTRGAGGVALPEQQGRAWRQCPQRHRGATVLQPFPHPPFPPPVGAEGASPWPWLSAEKVALPLAAAAEAFLGFGGCVCALAPGDRAPSDAGYVSTLPTAGSWELLCTAVSCWAPGSLRCPPWGSPQLVPKQTLPSCLSGRDPACQRQAQMGGPGRAPLRGQQCPHIP